jgi:hypothetical protein
MEPILHAMCLPWPNLDIGTARDISLKTSLQYATLTYYLCISYRVGRALRMIKGSYRMLYASMGLKYHLGSTTLGMQGTQTRSIVWYRTAV